MNNRKPLVMGDLSAETPVIQGGMGIGISLGGLAGAVAAEGGVGIISAAQTGFREPDFDNNTLQANLRAMKSEYEKARAAAPEGVIGFNIMVAMKRYGEYVKEAVRVGADIIISGAGLPTELPAFAQEAAAECKRDVKDIKLAPIVSTEKSAKVILKYWAKKYNIVPDLVIIEGPKAGGHLGFQKEQLEVFDEDTYNAELRHIMDVVKEYEKTFNRKIPVAIAGGIDTKEQADHAFAMGADAVQAASRFVTTEECDANIRYKEAYINAREEDIVIVKSPVGMPGRAILNPFMKRVMSGEKIPHGCHACLHKCNPSEIPYCITDALIHAAKGEVDEGLLFCGANAWKAEKIETVKEVIDSFF